MVEKHGIFQGYYFFHHIGLDRNLREQFRGHPSFEQTALCCERYDGPAFQPTLEAMPLEAFEAMMRRVFGAPKRSIYAVRAHRGRDPARGSPRSSTSRRATSGRRAGTCSVA